MTVTITNDKMRRSSVSGVSLWPTWLIINGQGVYRQDISKGRGLPLLYMLALLGVNKTIKIPPCQEYIQGEGIKLWWRGGGLD